MGDFVEKWNTDPKFKIKVKLGLYAGFMLIAVLFAFASRSSVEYKNNSFSNEEEKIISIKIPENYKYLINININGQEYSYEGNKINDEETITKKVDDITYNYIKQDRTYYKDRIAINNIISKEEIYDIIDYSYLNLETINQYLLVSKKEDNQQYIVYLKDIILGNDSQQKIIIEINGNKINIDYSSLLKLFDTSIESVNVEYIIEEIE